MNHTAQLLLHTTSITYIHRFNLAIVFKGFLYLLLLGSLCQVTNPYSTTTYYCKICNINITTSWNRTTIYHATKLTRDALVSRCWNALPTPLPLFSREGWTRVTRRGRRRRRRRWVRGTWARPVSMRRVGTSRSACVMFSVPLGVSPVSRPPAQLTQCQELCIYKYLYTGQWNIYQRFTGCTHSINTPWCTLRWLLLTGTNFSEY